MKVLIACEESQTVCKAFREKARSKFSPRYCKSYGGTVGLDHFREVTEMV